MKANKKFLFLLLFLWGGIFLSSYLPIPKSRLSFESTLSMKIWDRHQILLREVLSQESGRGQWKNLEEISPYLIKATLVAEDKNFFFHPGINLLSIGRALWQNLKLGKVVSGASTITQQVIRNIYRFPRNFFFKIIESWLSLRLENTLSKKEILAQYLNRIPYGNQTYGIEAAAQLYFAKSSSELDLAEAAFLASLLNPYRHFQKAKKRQQQILESLYRLGYITKEEIFRAKEENIVFRSEKDTFRAPHFCDYLIRIIPPKERSRLSGIQTCFDIFLQERIEILLKNHLQSLERRGITNGAAIVLDNRTGEILAFVGSRDYFDDAHDGQINGVLSPRQPGSALKAFTYALALEKGFTAASLIEDTFKEFPTAIGPYSPLNYDKKYHGLIRMRNALACSYNVPVVSVLQQIGADLLYLRLKTLGFESLKNSPSFYGIGLTLGNGEVTLLELVRAYSALARGRVFLREKAVLKVYDQTGKEKREEKKSEPIPLFSPLKKSFFEISFPQDGDVFRIDPELRREYQKLALRVSSLAPWKIQNLEWWINGLYAGRAEAPYPFFWKLKPGYYKIKAKARIDEKIMESSEVRFTILPLNEREMPK